MIGWRFGGWRWNPCRFAQLGTVPLAPIAAVADPARELPGIYRRVWGRLEREAPAKADDLWGITYVRSGLRHPPQMLAALMSAVHEMRSSATYQAILAEGEAGGEARGRREALIDIAREKLGSPDAQVLAALGAIDDVSRLAAMNARVWKVSTCAELLGASA